MKPTKMYAWITLLIITVLMFSPLINVKAHPTPTLTVKPDRGKVGEEITVSGTIDTENGTYQILFDGKIIMNGTAKGKNVNVNITVPEYPAGTYQIILRDVNASTESSPVEFTIETLYTLRIYPESKRIMEGQNLNISVTIVGGKNQTTYNLNMTVTTPTNKTYYYLFNANTDKYGRLSLNVTYPKEFSANANTNYTGIYIVKLNETLAEANFTIGITDKTEYHRSDIVKIQAAGYVPGENATITIVFPNETEISLPTVQALENGMINSTWTVPKDAPMGNYTIKIVGNQTSKTEKPDIQAFTIPGYSFNITALNFNMKPVPNVTFRIYEKGTSVYNATTNVEGKAVAKLEVGNYTFKAIYKEKLVNVTVREFKKEETLNFTLPLITLRFKVLDGRTFAAVPFASIEVSLNYTGINGENKSLKLTDETNIWGVVDFENMFANGSYLVKAEKYGVLFNTTYVDVPEKPESGTYNFSIYTPQKTLIVTVLNSKGEHASNLSVKVYEWTTGTASPIESSITDDEGKATLPLSFGWYKLRVFKGKILVNETRVELTSENETISATIYCKLLDLNLTIKVLDYFGVPIPKVKVALNISGVSYENVGDGEVTFENLIGGNCKISVFLPSNYDSPYIVKTVYLGKSEVLTLKDENHVSFLGTLIETRAFATIILVLVIAIVFAAIFIYRNLIKR